MEWGPLCIRLGHAAMQSRQGWVSAPIAANAAVRQPQGMNITQTQTQTKPEATSPSGSTPPQRVKVVGHDGSANGARVVEGAARRLSHGDRIIIIRAIEPKSSQSESTADHARIQRHMLSELGQRIPAGIDYEVRVIEGPPAETLIEVALEADADGIVIGTRRGPSRIGQRTILSELEDGPVPVVALYRCAQRDQHPDARQMDAVEHHGLDSFPASDPPSSW